MSAPQLHLDDPRPLVEAAFERVRAERMAGLPIVHPGLRIEATPFRRWSGLWLGALVTPWALNLVLVPGPGGRLTDVAGADRAFYRWPRGVFGFLAGHEPELGAFQSCSLVSPMSGFADHASAIATAREVVQLLLEPVRPAPREAAADLDKRRFLRTLVGRRSAA